jgi:hypothetical protein
VNDIAQVREKYLPPQKRFFKYGRYRLSPPACLAALQRKKQKKEKLENVEKQTWKRVFSDLIDPVRLRFFRFFATFVFCLQVYS